MSILSKNGLPQYGVYILYMEEIDLEIGTENENGIIFGDCFYLNYYGINVFFYVCKTNKDSACVYELAKKRVKYEGRTVEILCNNLVATKSPLVVLENNCYTKSNFWVSTTKDKCLIIPVEYLSPLYKKALEQGVEFPATGEFKALMLEEEKKKGFLRFYWEVTKPIKKIKKQKNKKITIRA